MKPRASDKLWSDPIWCAAHWGNRRGKPWSAEELTTANNMRAAGKSDADISVCVSRTQKSVTAKLGYQARSV
jgi:hypothetical protein